MDISGACLADNESPTSSLADGICLRFQCAGKEIKTGSCSNIRDPGNPEIFFNCCGYSVLCEYVPKSISTEDNSPRLPWEDMKGDRSSR